jgi:hypothetical protein
MNTIRLLTDEKTAQIKYFYKRPMRIGFGTIFILAFGVQAVIWASVFLNGNILINAILFVVVVIFLDQYKHYRKVARAKEVYQYGDEVTIGLVSVASNYGRKMNGMPQQIITINKGGEQISIKTFSASVIDAFSPFSQLAYVYTKYPDVILPSSIFSKSFYDPEKRLQPKPKIRSIDI